MTTEFTKRELEILRYHNNIAFHKNGHHLEGIKILYGKDIKPETLKVYEDFLHELVTVGQKLNEMVNKHDTR